MWITPPPPSSTTTPTTVSLHLRRVGLWTDGLSALVPASTVKTLRRLKLDGNSLGYLSGGLDSGRHYPAVPHSTRCLLSTRMLALPLNRCLLLRGL